LLKQDMSPKLNAASTNKRLSIRSIMENARPHEVGPFI
jgi:hypothetical protein